MRGHYLAALVLLLVQISTCDIPPKFNHGCAGSSHTIGCRNSEDNQVLNITEISFMFSKKLLAENCLDDSLCFIILEYGSEPPTPVIKPFYDNIKAKCQGQKMCTIQLPRYDEMVINGNVPKTQCGMDLSPEFFSSLNIEAKCVDRAELPVISQQTAQMLPGSINPEQPKPEGFGKPAAGEPSKTEIPPQVFKQGKTDQLEPTVVHVGIYAPEAPMVGRTEKLEGTTRGTEKEPRPAPPTEKPKQSASASAELKKPVILAAKGADMYKTDREVSLAADQRISTSAPAPEKPADIPSWSYLKRCLCYLNKKNCGPYTGRHNGFYAPSQSYIAAPQKQGGKTF